MPEVYMVDTALYRRYQSSFSRLTVDSSVFGSAGFDGKLCEDGIVYDLGQPLQLFVFDKEGTLVNYYTNCYGTGFPNLSWNRQGEFDVFPPKQARMLPFGNKPISFPDIRRTFAAVATNGNMASSPDYSIVIFCNIFMGRQSRRFVNSVQKSLSHKKSSCTVNVYYVNNDNLYCREKLWN
ncbi:MAG: hypothetical protein QM642_03125 [Edaphocola sp.]